MMDRDPLAYERRVKVFVSSRMTELATERMVVKEVIREMGLVPILFEDLNPKARPSEEVYLDGVRRSQIYLGLFRCEYASYDGPEMSATEQEYREATRLNLPRLILVKPCPREERDPRLTRLLAEVGDGRRGVVYKAIKDLGKLRETVRDAVAETVSENYQAPPRGQYEDLLESSLGLIRDRGWIERTAVQEARRLLETHPRVLVCGALGTGKTFLATRLAEESRGLYLPLAGRPVAFVLGYLDALLRQRHGMPVAAHASLEDLQLSLDLALQNSDDLIVIDGLDSNPDAAAHLAKLDFYSNQLLLVSRDQEVTIFGELARYTLEGFSLGEVTEYLKATTNSAANAAEAYERTRGNPLLLYHLARDSDAPPGADLNAYYARVWSSLPYSAQEAASLVALSLRPLDLGRLANLAGIGIPDTRERLDSLRGLIADEAGTFRFFHPTFSDYVESKVADQHLDQHYHRKLAEAFRQSGDRVGAAHHLLAAGDAGTAEVFLDAAMDANVEAAWIEVVRFARHVLEQGLPSTPTQETHALLLLGTGLTGTGDVEAAETAISRALVQCEQAGLATPLVVEAQAGLGWLQRTQGRLEAARRSYDLAVDTARDVVPIAQLAAIKSAFGQVLLELGDHDAALRLQQEALDAFVDLGDKRGESHALLHLGNVYLEQHKDEEALGLYRRAEELARELRLSRQVAAASTNAGIILRRQERYEDALAAYERALEVNHTLGDRHAESAVYLNMGNVRKDQGNFIEAEALYQRSLALSSGRFPSNEALVMRCLGDSCLEQGQTEVALTHYRQSVRIYEATEDREGLGYARLDLAHALAKVADYEGAMREYRAAAEAFSPFPEKDSFQKAIRGAITAAERTKGYDLYQVRVAAP